MITVIALGLLAMLACLALQVLASVFAARYFAQTSKQPFGPNPLRGIFRQFSILMIVLMIGNIVQVALLGIEARQHPGLDFRPIALLGE